MHRSSMFYQGRSLIFLPSFLGQSPCVLSEAASGKGNSPIQKRYCGTCLGQENNNPLVAIEHCRLSSIKDESPLFRHLAEIYSSRWPDCLQFKIFTAMAMLKTNEEAEAVKTLHACLSFDPEGVVARGCWGLSMNFFRFGKATNRSISMPKYHQVLQFP